MPLTFRSRTGALAAAGGAVLGLAALANHLVARRSERRHPPIGRFLDVDGVRLHYLDRGEGPPVVLLHGNGAMVEDFAASGLIDRLARDHRVVVFDRPGFGHSERPRGRVWTAAAQAELIGRALDRLALRRPVLVGHSWGTLVALEMALARSADVAALVLMSGYYVPGPRVDVALFSWPAVPVLGDLIRYTTGPLLGWLLSPFLIRKMFAPLPVTDKFARGFPLAMALRPSQIRATAQDTATMIPAAAATLGRRSGLSLPVTLVTGSEDAIVDPAGQTGALQADLPRSALRVLDGGGHMIHHTATTEVEAAIRAATGPVRDQAAE